MGFLSQKQKKMLNEFVKFVKNDLKIESVPKIQIVNGRGSLKTTANYDYTKKDKVIKVNGRNRATVDIMRSIAHELTHHKQYEQGRLKVKPPDIGGEIEDEANAKAGQYIKLFARKFPEIYELDEQLGTPIEKSDLSSPSSTTTSSTSDLGGGSSSYSSTSSGDSSDGYPEVGHWESGITRGPANQLGNTKWSDTVGSKITRGKANQLK